MHAVNLISASVSSDAGFQCLMEVPGGHMFTSPRDLECKKVKTTQAHETELGLKFIVKLREKQT